MPRPCLIIDKKHSSCYSHVDDKYFHLAIEMGRTKKKIGTILKQQGYRLTPQRRAVLNAIANRHDHLTPAALYKRVHPQQPSIGLATVYRTLEILAELGLICEVHTGGGCRSYLLRRPSEHHHHLICAECGVVVDFIDCDLGELEQRLSQKTGFEIENHLLEFFGHCRDCDKTPPI